MTKTNPTESDVKREVKKILTHHGWFWWMPAANGFGSTGVSDFLALKAGVFMAIETKLGKNPTTVMQKGFLSSIQAEDGFAFVVNEKTVEAFKLWMLAYDAAVEATAQGLTPNDSVGAAMLNGIAAMTRDF